MEEVATTFGSEQLASRYLATCSGKDRAATASSIQTDLDAKRTAIIEAVAAARKAHMIQEAESEARVHRERKATAKDLFEDPRFESKEPNQNDGGKTSQHVKDYRMQGNFGQTKFIKP